MLGETGIVDVINVAGILWPMWYFVRPPIYELESETETETDRAETETETKTIKNRSREVSRPRPGLETNITA